MLAEEKILEIAEMYFQHVPYKRALLDFVRRLEEEIDKMQKGQGGSK